MNNGEFRSVDAREVSAEYYFKNKLSFLVRIHDHLEYHWHWILDYLFVTFLLFYFVFLLILLPVLLEIDKMLEMEPGHKYFYFENLQNHFHWSYYLFGEFKGLCLLRKMTIIYSKRLFVILLQVWILLFIIII